MFLHVFLEVTSVRTAEGTLITTERLFSRMNPLVSFENASLFGGVSALCASKRLLITVNSRVLNEGAVFIASVVTLIATVRLLCTIRSLIGMF